MQLGYQWGTAGDVVVDAKGRYVLVGSNQGRDQVEVACLTPDLELVWKSEHALARDDVHLAPMPDGRILLWQHKRHSAIVLDDAGQPVGTLGGREPVGSTLPMLDFSDAADAIVDRDGTILLVVADRLQRFDAGGTGTHTWPQTGLRALLHNRLDPLYTYHGEDRRELNRYPTDMVRYWGRRPLALHSSDTRGTVAGGALYLASTHGDIDRALGKIARDGRCLWSLWVPYMMKGRPAIDAAGNVHVMSFRSDRFRLHRVAADGKSEQVIAEDWHGGGPLMRPSIVTVLADGTIGLWSAGSELTMLDASGGLLYHSPRATEILEIFRADRQKKIRNDEEVDR